MTAPLSARLFGLHPNDPFTESVQYLVERLRAKSEDKPRLVIVAQADDSVADAHTLFRTHDLHHLPVVQGNKVVGMVSPTELLNFFAECSSQQPSQVKLETIMTPEPRVLSREAPIRELVAILAHSSFRGLPIVTSQGEIWDIITTRDLVRYLEMKL